MYHRGTHSSVIYWRVLAVAVDHPVGHFGHRNSDSLCPLKKLFFQPSRNTITDMKQLQSFKQVDWMHSYTVYCYA